MTTIEAIKLSLAALKPTSIEVIDDSAAHAGHAGAKSGGGHFRLLIVAPIFAGRRPMERHRLVYDALASLMKQEIHALSINAKTPDES